jgi:heat shock protein HslJ
MKNILFSIFAVLVLTITLNCSSAKIKNPHIHREWMLISFNNFTKEDLIKNKAEIDLTETENKNIKGKGFMGCNKIFFTAEFKNKGKVKISQVGSTLMVCENSRLESVFLKNFDKMIKYSVEGHFLILSDENGNMMKFVAADWD